VRWIRGSVGVLRTRLGGLGRLLLLVRCSWWRSVLRGFVIGGGGVSCFSLESVVARADDVFSVFSFQ
jgi:hypothetical protein